MIKDFVTKLATYLTDSPDEVRVEEMETPEGKLITLHVAQADMGKVIGKGGRIIKALRDLVRVKAIKSGERVSVNLAE